MLFSLAALIYLTTACDTGLSPTDELPAEGSLVVNISYTGEWPPEEELLIFRFVALEFQPESLIDFFRIEEMLISEELERNAASETVIFREVPNNEYFFSGIAWQFGPNLFADWRTAGEYRENNGYFRIDGNLVEIDVLVDFNNLPVFPPVFED